MVIGMRFFKNRGFAITITVVIAIVSMFLGVHRSLNKFSNDIETMFYEGIYLEESKYTQPSIQSKLDQCADQVLGIATIITNNQQLKDNADELVLLRRELLSAESIKAKSASFKNLTEAVDRTSKMLADTDLSEADINSVSDYLTRFHSAEEFIGNAAYNSAASERWNAQSNIARLFNLLIPAAKPEEF